MTNDQRLCLEVEQLSCARNSKTLFEGLNFSLHSGEIMIIEGNNGSGKTTLLKILCGLRTPDKGKIKFNSQEINDLDRTYNEQLVYLSHKNGVKTDLTARENLNSFCHVYGQPTEFVDEVLIKMELVNEADISCRSLSEGQNRRVALARLLLCPAPIWILDEPLTALDEAGVELVKKLFHLKLQRQGMIIVSSHHDLNIDEGIGMQRIDLTPPLLTSVA